MTSMSTGAAGVPASRKYPSVYSQVKFGASPNSAGGATRTVCIIGNKSSAGTATLDTTIYGPLTPDSALPIFGSGSEVYLGVVAAAAAEPGATVYAIAATPSAGAAAAQTLTVAGVAGGDGNVAIKIHGYTVNVAILSGTTAANSGIAIKNAINGKGQYLNVTATDNGAGVVTITHRHTGTRGNSILLFVTVDASITTQTFTLAGAALVGGTTADTMTTALTTTGARKFDYYAMFTNDTTALQAFQTKVLAAAGPLVRKRAQGIAGNVDTQGNATTQATTLNEPRLQILWMKKGEDIAGVAACAFAAMRSVAESDNPNYHFSRFNPDAVDMFGILHPPTSEADYVLESESNSALDSGLTPIEIRQGDKHPMVVLSITTHSQDSLGNPDTRTMTTNMVTVPDHWADEVESYVPSAFPGMNLRDDPQEGDDPLPPNTVTPQVVKGHLVERYTRLFDQKGFVKNAALDTATWAFNLDTNNANRMDATMMVTPAPWLTQLSAQILQGSGQ